MNTSNGIWVPSYYQRRHPFLWIRGAAGPRHIDWIAGVMLAVLALGLVAHASLQQRHENSAAALATPTTIATQLSTDEPPSGERGGAPSMR
jgi:hypothetical protein